jgi:hypothetical protein
MKRIAVALIVFAGCRTPAPDQTLEPRDAAAISASSGAVSQKLVPDPDSPEVTLGPDEQFIPPQLDPSNPGPTYPAELIQLRLPPYTVGMRVTFDERGNVLDILPSPIAASTEGPHRPAFEDATRAALRRWHCWAPQIRKFRPGPDADGDGKPDYRIMSDRRSLKTFFDVSFAFEVVNGVPVVKSAAPK